MSEEVSVKVQKCKCGLAVWRHEGTFKVLTEFIDKKDKNWSLNALDGLKKDFDRVEQQCEVDATDAKKKIEDARWHLERENWMDAKWDVLFASAKLLDKVKECAREQR